LLIAGAVGLFLFHSRRAGGLALAAVLVALTLLPRMAPVLKLATPADGIPTLGGLARLFAAIGAFTVGGGLTMIALIQEHVVDRLHWLTPREFVDGLALGQLTPGPVLMLAAYVGYKVLGVSGALVAATASFLPSFAFMLGLLPVFERIRDLRWARAVMQGLIPGVIGVMAVALVRMMPDAAPDPPAVAALMVTAAVLILWRLAPLKVMAAGSVFGVLRTQPWVK
jgi:chromate transporter